MPATAPGVCQSIEDHGMAGTAESAQCVALRTMESGRGPRPLLLYSH